MTPISNVRFDAIAGYARMPIADLFGEELAYFEVEGGKVVGMLLVDHTDGDFLGLVFARDARLRYRSAAGTMFFPTLDQAEAALAEAMDAAAAAPPEDQSIEQNQPCLAGSTVSTRQSPAPMNSLWT